MILALWIPLSNCHQASNCADGFVSNILPSHSCALCITVKLTCPRFSQSSDFPDVNFADCSMEHIIVTFLNTRRSRNLHKIMRSGHDLCIFVHRWCFFWTIEYQSVLWFRGIEKVIGWQEHFDGVPSMLEKLCTIISPARHTSSFSYQSAVILIMMMIQINPIKSPYNAVR